MHPFSPKLPSHPACHKTLRRVVCAIRKVLVGYPVYSLFLKIIYLAVPGLYCSMWDLVPQPGIEPRPPALGVQSLSHWTTTEVSEFYFQTNENHYYSLLGLVLTVIFVVVVYTKSCLTLCNPIDCSTPGYSVLHYLPEFAQIHVH